MRRFHTVEGAPKIVPHTGSKQRHFHFSRPRHKIRLLGGVLCALFLLNYVMPSFGAEFDLELIDPNALRASLSQWTLLDARPRDRWEERRLPGALSFHWGDITNTDDRGVRYRTPAPERLAELLGEMGISESDSLVVYGDADSSWGGEGWACWVLTLLGHQGRLRLLDGGIQAWKEQGFPLDTGKADAQRSAAEYRLSLRPEVEVSVSELAEDPSRWTLVDTRSTLEWFMGSRLPGAIHIPWTEFFTGSERRPLDPRRTHSLLKREGGLYGAARCILLHGRSPFRLRLVGS